MEKTMHADYVCRVAGAVFNLLCCDDYGRVDFVSRRFNISRSTLYRKKDLFLELFGSAGRPGRTASSVGDFKKRFEVSERKVGELNREIEKHKQARTAEIAKLTFLLIAVGLSGRVIAWILRTAFGLKANHSGILKQAKQYAAIATKLMQDYFHPCAKIVAVDEVFVEQLPVFVAVAPRSLLVCNASVYGKRTEENWSTFLDEMENMEGTVSDRGRSILAAVGKRENHTHQSDLFHCKHTIMPELLKLETQCYGLINKEEQARQKLEKRKAYCKDVRGAACTLRAAKKKCAEKIELFDHLEQAVKLAFDALRLSNGSTFNRSEQARQTLAFVCDWIACIHPRWKKVISALKDQHLLGYMDVAHEQIAVIDVDATGAVDREFVLATLTRLWEQQAHRRWRGRSVIIPQDVLADLHQRCPNLDSVRDRLFGILENTVKSSSAVECINSRIGFFRYSKKRFSDEFANFICVIHNLTPFLDGKRKGKTPAGIENVPLPTKDIFELFGVI